MPLQESCRHTRKKIHENKCRKRIYIIVPLIRRISFFILSHILRLVQGLIPPPENKLNKTIP